MCKIKIIIATETGNSIEVGETINRYLIRRKVKTSITLIETYNLQNLPNENIIIFVISTTGQGNVPNNMKKFWKNVLRKSLNKFYLNNVKYTIFGLGDSSYPLYNAASRKLYARLKQLGAKPIYKIGFGDDQHDLGYNFGLEKWLPDFFKESLSKFISIDERFISTNPIINHNTFLPSQFKVKSIRNKSKNKDENKSYIPKNYSPFLCKIMKNERLTHIDHFQDVRKISFDIKNHHIKYKSGDVLNVFYNNREKETLRLLEILKLNKTDLFKIEKNNKLYIEEISAYDLFKKHLGILEVPKKYFFEIMSQYSLLEREREKLKHYLSIEGAYEFSQFCYREHRTYVEVLESFPNSIPPLEYLIESIPVIKPRLYSISSFCHNGSDRLEITVALVKYKTPYGRIVHGVCSDFLAQQKPNTTLIPIWITKGSFIKPKKFMNTPLIAIGPGTGLAPLKSIIEEKYELYSNSKMELGKVFLFLGHRYSKKDYLYNSEFWDKYIKSKIISHFSVAFSRDTSKKHYVFHDLRKYSKLLWNLIDTQKAYILVAGNSHNMPMNVYDTFINIVENEGGLNKDKSKAYLKKMERNMRYQVETW